MRARKSAFKDFSIDLLPKNRKEQFFDLLKTRGNILFKLVIVSFIGSLVLLLLFGFKYLGVLPQARIHISDDNELLAFIRTNTIIFDAAYIVGIVIYFISLSGMANVLKKIAWDENVVFWKDIKLGIKANWKQYLVVGIIFAIIRFCVNTFSILIANIYLKYVPYAIYILILPIFSMSLSIGNIYQSKIFEAFSNGTAYCFKNALKTLLFVLIPVIFKTVSYIVNDLFAIPLLGGGLLLLFFIIAPLICLMWHLYTLSLFDRFTNEKYYPNYFHKGLADSKYLKEKRNNIFLFEK